MQASTSLTGLRRHWLWQCVCDGDVVAEEGEKASATLLCCSHYCSGEG